MDCAYVVVFRWILRLYVVNVLSTLWFICDKYQCRKLNLLSFGEEAEEEEKELAAVKKKIKSSHDVLDDPRLLKDAIPSSDLVIINHLQCLL